MLEKGFIINNRYEILSRVGAGGMSDVYKAKDHKLNRNVAMKVLKSEFSKDKNFLSKFRVEAQSAASLIHPNIVNVYDVGDDAGLYYIVMELIEGITLKSYINKKRKLSVKETISIAIQIANGIECAHNNQIVHRDIKPQNIMISREGKVKVTDFGIARAASSNTINGSAMGSVHYISPEQAGGQYVDEKSDIYSLGITMFEMLTGTVPFDGESTVTIALKHIKNNVPSIKEYVPDIPVSIERIVLKCTQNKAERRYPKISLLIADLKKALTNPNLDFVQLEQEVVSGSTIMIKDKEMDQIRKEIENRNNADKDDNNEDDIDALSPKMDKAVTVGGVVAGIVALVVIAAIVTNFVFSLITNNKIKLQNVTTDNTVETTIDPKKTEVPNVVGMSEDEAEKTLHDKELGVKYEAYEYNDLYPSGFIISQSVKKGEIIDKNETILLTVSKGSEKIEVPTGIKGADLNTAISLLEEKELKWELVYEYSGKEINNVISCYPIESARVSKGDIIKLTLSRGQDISENANIGTVPNVEGKKLAKAQQLISGAGFLVGTTVEEYSETVEKGVVIRQTIKSGAAPKGATVCLVVSRGSESAENQFSGTYTFTMEDLMDGEGNPITSGTVVVLLNGSSQGIDPQYSDVSKWPGDYTMTLTGDVQGKATIELFINNVLVKTDSVILN